MVMISQINLDAIQQNLLLSKKMLKQSQSESAIIRIKNITFNKQFVRNPDKQLISLHLRLGRTINSKTSDLKKINKENIDQYYYFSKKIKNFRKRQKITQMFCIKTMNLKNKFPHEKYQNYNQRKLSYAGKTHRKSSENITRNRQINSPLNRSLSKKLTYQEQTNKLMQLSNTLAQKEILIQKNKSKLCLGTKDSIFQKKYFTLCQKLLEVAQLHQIQVKFGNYKKAPTYYIGKGNNSKLLKQCMKRRWWWSPVQQKQKNNKLDVNYKQVNFIWTQLKIKDFYHETNTLKEKQPKQQFIMHNHFQFNQFLGNKKALFYNMKRYYEKQNKNPYDFIPLTFHIKNINQPSYQQFQSIYKQKYQSNKNKFWILKPGQNSNRGRGITLHTSLEQIQNVIKNPQNKQRTFIVQEYIEKPFLYNRRKFDIRCYFLLVTINNSIKGYWYKDGYIRTSCFQFNCSSTENNFIHLTNDAIQKNCEDYGKYQDGNKLDFSTFKKYLNFKYGKKYDFDTKIYSKLKQIAIDSIKASYRMIKSKKQFSVLQLFGLDFMIDQNFKPWLIQINTNPCLQTSCAVLQKIIPNVVDNALKLSLDVVFPPPETWSKSKKHLICHTNNDFELVFDQKNDQQKDKGLGDQIIETIGQMEEDQQIYEE